MATVERVLKATPQKVWDVLADGWLYPLWVVGASRMRDVDAAWPHPGSRLHHSVGVWPVLIDDDTVVLEARPSSLLVVQARGWPAGEARVSLHLEEHGAGTRVVLEEDATHGPGTLVPKPVRAPLLNWRNVETLRRLAYLAERRG